MQRANSARRVSESIKEQGAQILQNNFLTEGDNNVQFFISFNLKQKNFFFFKQQQKNVTVPKKMFRVGSAKRKSENVEIVPQTKNVLNKNLQRLSTKQVDF